MILTPIKKCFACICIAGALSMGTAQAVPITIGSAQRTGTLDWAIDAGVGNGNLNASLVNTAFGGSWTSAGHIDDDTGSLSNGMLSLTFTLGTWDGTNVAGTWTINPAFWTTYTSAVIGWHVGNGGGDPDNWMFLIQPGQTSGTWSYQRLSGGGGGFSNMQLYGSGTPTGVPEGGNTLLLMGLVLGGVAAWRRFLKP